MSIAIYPNSPTPVRHAAHRLADYTGLPIGLADSERAIRVELKVDTNPPLGAQGYEIQSVEGPSIVVSANTAGIPRPSERPLTSPPRL